MKRFVKRAVLVVLAVVIVVVGGVAAILVSTFRGNLPPQTEPYADGTEPIVDGHVTAFAIPLADPTQVALIDCGNDPAAVAIKAALDAHHQKVAAIFITHGHPDHTGGCAQFRDVPVYALADEVEGIEGRRAFRGPLTRLMGAKDTGTRVDHALHDGDEVDVGGVKVMVFAATGHTAGSAVYRARTTLFFGDAATAKEPQTLVGPPWIFSDDAKQGAGALFLLADKLKDEAALKTFAFAHSGPIPADVAKLRAFGAE